MMNELWPVGIAAALVAAAYAHRRLMRAAQPLRLELAEKGETLLANPRFPKPLRYLVQGMLDTAFGNRGFLIFSFFAVPIFAIILIVRPSYIESDMHQFSLLDAEIKTQLTEISRLHDRILVCHHPIMTFLLEFEILAFVPISVLISGLIHGNAPKRANRDEVISFIETKEQKVFSYIGHAAANSR